jgi:hypothetical protein
VVLIPVYVWLLLVWTAYAIDISPTGRLDRSGHIKGHDFAHFYVLGEIANEHAAEDLYDFSAQADRMDRLVPSYENRFLPIHAPQVAMFFGPLARLPYETAVTVWLVLSAVVYAGCCYAMWAVLPNLDRHGWIVALLAAAFPAFYGLITFGQTSAFALLWLVLGFLALRSGRPWLAGLMVGSLAYKPTLLLVLPLAFIYQGQFQVVLGAVAAALVQFAAAWFFLGKAAIVGYVINFKAVAASGFLLEARPELMHSLKAFFSILLPWPTSAMVLYIATALVVIVIALRNWRTAARLELRYSVLLLATVLVDPHVYTYELVVLVPAFLLAASWVLERPGKDVRFWMVMGLCYMLPALTPLTSVTRIQWSVPALATLMGMLVLSARPVETSDIAQGQV